MTCSGSEDQWNVQTTSLQVLRTECSARKGTAEAPRIWMVGHFYHHDPLPTLMPTCARSPRTSNLQLLRVCIHRGKVEQPGQNALKPHSQSHVSARMKTGTEQLSKVIASYLPGQTRRYEPFCRLHEICSQKPWKQKNNMKAFYPLTIYIYQHCCSFYY